MITPHKGESEARFQTRLAARWQQPNETSYEFAVRLKAHHARVCIDNDLLSDVDEDWETMKKVVHNLADKAPTTHEKLVKGFEGEYHWRWCWQRALLWHFDRINKRKQDIVVNKEISRYANSA
jgi:hypothetical protein